MTETIPQLLTTLGSRGWADHDLAATRRAYDLVTELFGAQFRPDGKPFIDHLIGTAAIVADEQCERPVVVAALLHSAYTLGDFGDGRLGALAKRRDEVRSVIGEDAERIVHRYGETSRNRAVIDALVLDTAGLSGVDRDVVLVRIANEIDDHEALGYRYRGFSGDEIAAAPQVAALIDAAHALDRPQLAARLQAAVDAEVHSAVSPALVFRKASFTVMPRSARRRFGWWVRVDPGPVAQSLRNLRGRVPWKVRRT